MAKHNTIRVYPDGHVWVVKKDSASKASAIKNTKEQALIAAKEIAVNQRLTIIMYVIKTNRDFLLASVVNRQQKLD
jgi:hypothetical protein